MRHYFCVIRETDGAVQRSLIFHTGGAQLYEHLQEKGAENNFEVAVRALDKHFDPQLNSDYEPFKLRQARQMDLESINTFYTRLRKFGEKGKATQ